MDIEAVKLTMYILINASKTLCCGLFPTKELAEDWSSKQAVALEPIELLLHPDHADALVKGELTTSALDTFVAVN